MRGTNKLLLGQSNFGSGMQVEQELLIALRRIIRAIDLHSKKLNRESGLTGPQLIILQTIQSLPEVTPKRLAQEVTLSQGTVTVILDRLTARGLVERVRSETDRRSYHLTLSEEGAKVLSLAPALLQNEFIDRFSQLEQWEQTQILSSVQRVAVMMDAVGIDAAPMLELGTLQDARY
jgi:DNA-binding MarR family transcriptional regulator